MVLPDQAFWKFFFNPAKCFWRTFRASRGLFRSTKPAKLTRSLQLPENRQLICGFQFRQPGFWNVSEAPEALLGFRGLLVLETLCARDLLDSGDLYWVLEAWLDIVGIYCARHINTKERRLQEGTKAIL